VSVIIPARNAAATLGRTLAALAEQRDVDPYEVIVVDNASSDETGAVARAAGGPVRVIAGDGSGPGSARNLGAAAARADVLAFTDSDCFPTRRWLASGIAAIAAADLVQGRVQPDPTVPLGPFDRTVWVDGERGFYETANLFVTRGLFERVGGFEDWRATGEHPFGEDLWFGWRAVRAGATTSFAPDALVHHAVFPRGPLEFIAERLRMRNFPAVVRQVPEFRMRPLVGRVFMSRRSAALDAAIAGVAIAAARRSVLPLAAAAPYAWMVGRWARPYRRRAPLVAAVGAAADLAGVAALLYGSVRARSLVL
jgi:GT2 family glycosyltransferase